MRIVTCNVNGLRAAASTARNIGWRIDFQVATPGVAKIDYTHKL